MRTYQVLLVDDHRVILDGLQAMIDWEACGYRLVGAAESGHEALEILEKTPCDLLITDVRMPDMNGLELIERVRRRMSDIEIMVISAYGEFEYAKTAMQFGVNSYLLKPISSEKLIESLLLTHSALAERDRRRQHELERLLLKLLLSPRHSVKNEDFQKVGIPADAPRCCLALLQLDALGEKILNLFGSDETGETAQDVVMRFLEKHLPCHSALISDNRMLVVFLPESGDPTRLQYIVSGLAEYLEQYCGAHIQAVIGDIVATPSALSATYARIESVMNSAAFWNHGGILVASAAEDIKAPLSFDATALLSAVRSASASAAERELQQLLCQLRAERPSVERVRLAMAEIMFRLSDAIAESSGSIQEALGRDDFHHQLYRLSSMDELSQYLTRTVRSLCEYLGQNVRRDGQIRVADVERYIQLHYAESLTVKRLSEIFFISPVYLGRLFSSRVGVSLNSYVNAVRIKNAQTLLKNTDMKVYAVCTSVGYKSIKYFYKIFKDEVGMTPHEYRLIHGA